MADEGRPISHVVGQLRALGLKRGDVVLAHLSYRAARPIAGGPAGLVEALLRCVGPEGAVVMPSWPGAFDRPFDPRAAPADPELGAAADLFWRLPGAVRGDTPFAFAAKGPQAELIVSGPLMLPPHQPESPVGRVLSAEGRILLVGLGHEANTSLHLAEWLAGVPYRTRQHIIVFSAGAARRVGYDEARHCFRLYAKTDAWMSEAGLQIVGEVGAAKARLMRSRDLIETVVAKLRADPLCFLHPPEAQCPPCDEARRSIVA